MAVMAPVMAKKIAMARPRTLAGEALDDDADRCGEHDRAADALQGAGGDEPRLGEVADGREAAQQRGDAEAGDADQRHALVADDIGDAPAEQEERGGGEQVDVDRPLHAVVAEAEVLLDGRRGERDDRLVDRRHRDGEDEPGEGES